MDYRVLLYYKYTTIEEPEEFRRQHLAFCKENDLKGRILVSEEGINGTVSGTFEATQQYMDTMHADTRFSDMVFKIDPAEGHAFKKMHVRYRPEIVSLQLEDDLDPNETTGKYLEPKEFRKALVDENTIVIDARNDYEYDLGHFRGAVRPDIKNFRDLPEWIRENKEKFMDKKVVTYCTGGIRCEKFSGWLLKEGFEDVGQLHGGIHTYGTDPEVQGDLWDGKMYVFDERISVPINRKEHVIIGKDWFDGSPCERYVNCGDPKCNRQILTSEENERKYLRGCSHECRISPENRYVKQHHLSREEVAERLAVINEKLPEMA
ncbi:rhodanese-related sulfurtransferase [Desemzia sp. RIT804]|uniref:oxygen-dependent tRNA uridine(34) hydroxylase TrhO n=1 Tax=Desemzia sp. RIT 804 TaxID=2810209 RepID=UPI00194DEA9E|nr:rhodanese-related sulfurtransferase [Desemzia sp. RIT 804]MBM6613344.1 rhodanese-related sulfurtransferase [Desemzia sp. RIT 804]